MNKKINITCNKYSYTVWLNDRVFLNQPIHLTNKIPLNITPQAYWYLHLLNVLHQHGLLNTYKNINKTLKF